VTKLLPLLLLVAACSAAPKPTRTGPPAHLREPAAVVGRIEVAVTGIPAVEGQLYVELYDQATYFRYADVLNERIVAVTGTEMVVALEHVPPGRYIAAVSHDRNSNHTLDTGWFGIPKEAYGFSQGARGRLGPPSFEEGAFTFAGGTQRIMISIR
jgi:uncharacterized protein (DUF2141 family)